MLVYVRPSNEALPIDFPHFALRGAARLSFTARIEGAHSDRAASASKKDGLAIPAYPFQARSFLSPAGGPIGLLLRASNEHILIVRVARARETNGLPDSLNPPFLPPPNL
jgi:hypothetical protein